MVNENIDETRVNDTANTLTSGGLENAMSKAQQIQNVGSFLKGKYYPELSFDEINERVNLLMDKGLDLEQIVDQINNGKIDLTLPVEEFSKEIIKQDEEQTLG